MEEFQPGYWTTVVGSFPHKEAGNLCKKLVDVLDVPDWPQLPRRNFRENMYVQYSSPLPALVVDDEKEKVFFDTSGDISRELETFYEHYLAEDLDYFALPGEYARGFYSMLELLKGENGGGWVKGQVTGPVSFGLTVTDQDLRASLYDDLLADAIVKNAAMNARWQARKLKETGRDVFIFVDEPYMASFGSSFISLGREQVVAMLGEVFESIHAEGALAGVHCCANTDWSVLLETPVDILNLDAFGFIENLALYPVELRSFLDRGGVVAWGIVPNNPEVNEHSPEQLANRLRDGLLLIESKAQARGVDITAAEFHTCSLVAPACGLGSTDVQTAEKVLDALAEVGRLLG